MAFVCKNPELLSSALDVINSDPSRDIDYENDPDILNAIKMIKKSEILGMMTLEDVIEVLLTEKVYDETDDRRRSMNGAETFGLPSSFNRSTSASGGGGGGVGGGGGSILPPTNNNLMLSTVGSTAVLASVNANTPMVEFSHFSERFQHSSSMGFGDGPNSNSNSNSNSRTNSRNNSPQHGSFKGESSLSAASYLPPLSLSSGNHRDYMSISGKEEHV
jgi:hypothetical protein